MAEEALRTLRKRSPSWHRQPDSPRSPRHRLAGRRPCRYSTIKPRKELNPAIAPSSGLSHHKRKRLSVGGDYIDDGDPPLPYQSSTPSTRTFQDRNAGRHFSKSAIPPKNQEYCRKPRRKTRQDRYELKEPIRLRKQPIVKEKGRKPDCKNQHRRNLKTPTRDEFEGPSVLQDRITVGNSKFFYITYLLNRDFS